MRELHGVVSTERISSEEYIKHLLVYFDCIHLASPRVLLPNEDLIPTLQYLRARGVISTSSIVAETDWVDPAEVPSEETEKQMFIDDLWIRTAAKKAINPAYDVVGVYARSPWVAEHTQDDKKFTVGPALRVGFNALPMPDETCALDDILSFKQDLREQQWGFRRFLRDLGTKQKTEGEMKDEIEWFTHQYTKAMKIHHLKGTKRLLETYIVPAAGVLANLKEINWPSLAVLGVWALQRMIDQREFDLKTPGMECAYVFEARKKFGKATVE